MGMFAEEKILVVGGAGFVGSNLVRRLLAEQAKQIVVVDNLLSAESDNLPTDGRVRLVTDTIASDKVLGTIDDTFDYIFHLATFHGNQSSIHDPIADHDNNTITSLKLFNHVRSFKHLKKLVYSGAGCAVAEKTFDSATATEESDFVKIDGDSPYSLSKMFGEFYAKYFHKQYNTPIVRARFQNVYGPGEVLGAGKWRGTPATVWRNVTPTFVWRALEGLPITIENDGIATRDFIYVDDIVEGLVQLAKKGKPPEAYNLATGEETSIRKLAELVMQYAKSKSELQFLPKRSWDHSGKRFGSTSKSEKELGFTCKVSTEIGIKKTLEWTVENRERIRKNIEKHQKSVEAYALSEKN